MQARDGLHYHRDVTGSEEATCHVSDTHRGAEHVVIRESRVLGYQEGLRRIIALSSAVGIERDECVVVALMF
jgi:hypothetical protein